MALVADYHLTVSHVAAHLDFSEYRERTIHASLALDVVCNCETTEPLLLNGINFVNVRVDGADRFTYDGFFVRAWLDNWRQGQHHRITVSYTVVKPVCGVTFVPHRDGTVSIGCDFEACSSRYMLASQDSPAFAATWELHIRAPAGLTRLGTGKLVSEVSNADGSMTSIWRQDRSIPSYLVSFVVGSFRRVDDCFFGPLELDEECIRRTFGATRKILSWLEGRFGALPCHKFYQVLLEISTAMENESLVLYPPSTYALRSEAEKEEHGWNTDRVMCHETVHSYFGNLVHIASWAHLWVKEGFATMLPHVFAYECVSQDMGDYIYMRDYFVNRRSGGQQPACYQPVKHADEIYTSDTYSGSCMRLWNLRGMLGEQCFWDGVSLFLSSHGGKASVDTHDLMRCMERASFRDLFWWFDQWIFKTGTPLLSVVVNKGVLTLAVLDTRRRWRFDMDVRGGPMAHFTSQCRNVSVPLDGDVIDFNVSQRVPCKFDLKRCSVPRAVLMATLASRDVSITTKALLFELLDEADLVSVFRLERRWAVRGAFVLLDRPGVGAHAVAHDTHPIVRSHAVMYCDNSDLLVSRFDSFACERTRDMSLRRITNVPFLFARALEGREDAVISLGRVKAVKELDALPRNAVGLEIAYSLCGQRTQLLTLLEKQVANNAITADMAAGLVRVGAPEALRLHFPKLVSESVYLLDVGDASEPVVEAQPSGVAATGLDWTSIVFGALVAGVVFLGRR